MIAPPSHIYLIAAATGEVSAVLNTSMMGKIGEDLPSWSPDGTALAFRAFGGEGDSLMIYLPGSDEFIEGGPSGYGGLGRPLWSPRPAYGPDCRQ